MPRTRGRGAIEAVVGGGREHVVGGPCEALAVRSVASATQIVANFNSDKQPEKNGDICHHKDLVYKNVTLKFIWWVTSHGENPGKIQ